MIIVLRCGDLKFAVDVDNYSTLNQAALACVGIPDEGNVMSYQYELQNQKLNVRCENSFAAFLRMTADRSQHVLDVVQYKPVTIPCVSDLPKALTRRTPSVEPQTPTPTAGSTVMMQLQEEAERLNASNRLALPLKDTQEQQQPTVRKASLPARRVESVEDRTRTSPDPVVPPQKECGRPTTPQKPIRSAALQAALLELEQLERTGVIGMISERSTPLRKAGRSPTCLSKKKSSETKTLVDHDEDEVAAVVKDPTEPAPGSALSYVRRERSRSSTTNETPSNSSEQPHPQTQPPSESRERSEALNQHQPMEHQPKNASDDDIVEDVLVRVRQGQNIGPPVRVSLNRSLSKFRSAVLTTMEVREARLKERVLFASVRLTFICDGCDVEVDLDEDSDMELLSAVRRKYGPRGVSVYVQPGEPLAEHGTFVPKDRIVAPSSQRPTSRDVSRSTTPSNLSETQQQGSRPITPYNTGTGQRPSSAAFSYRTPRPPSAHPSVPSIDPDYMLQFSRDQRTEQQRRAPTPADLD